MQYLLTVAVDELHFEANPAEPHHSVKTVQEEVSKKDGAKHQEFNIREEIPWPWVKESLGYNYTPITNSKKLSLTYI